MISCVRRCWEQIRNSLWPPLLAAKRTCEGSCPPGFVMCLLPAWDPETVLENKDGRNRLPTLILGLKQSTASQLWQSPRLDRRDSCSWLTKPCTWEKEAKFEWPEPIHGLVGASEAQPNPPMSSCCTYQQRWPWFAYYKKNSGSIKCTGLCVSTRVVNKLAQGKLLQMRD